MLNTKGFYRLIDFYQSPILIYYAVPFITEETTNWVIITGAELCGLNMVELQKRLFLLNSEILHCTSCFVLFFFSLTDKKELCVVHHMSPNHSKV